MSFGVIFAAWMMGVVMNGCSDIWMTLLGRPVKSTSTIMGNRIGFPIFLPYTAVRNMT